MLLLQYSRSTLFLSSGGGIFVITITFLGSWRTLLLDVMCSAVYVSYFRTLEHMFVLFQVTFICKQVLKTLSCISFFLPQVRLKWEILWNHLDSLVQFVNALDHEMYSSKTVKFWLSLNAISDLNFGLMVFANIHTVGNTLSPAICVEISSIGVTVRILFCLSYQDLQSLDMSITFWLLCKHNRVNQVVSWSPDDALGFHSFWKGDKSISKYH